MSLPEPPPNDDFNLFRFGGDEFPVFARNDDFMIPLRAMAEAISLDVDPQRRLISRSHWSEGRTTVMTVQLPGDTQARPTYMLSHRVVPMWIANINASRIQDEDVRAKVIEWQREFADALYRYVFEGGAISETATDDQLAALADELEARRALRAKRRIELLAVMGDGVDPQWRENRMRHEYAVVVGEEADIDPQDRLLTVDGYLEDRGVGKVDLRSIRSVFGKRVKALYVAHHGHEPKKVDGLVDGRDRKVNGYYERDRFLFDQAFERWYSHLAGPTQLELGGAA